ncbi:MAG: hypothetical protein O9972_42870 [Burkholderiales bacterium]|nr:hypothetical protein [Burkholderiales bacterium]
MNAPARAYARTARIAMTTREIEASLLVQCAVDIERARACTDDARALPDALTANCRVWHELAEGAAANDGAPIELRAGTLRLARFVMASTRKILETPDPVAVQTLIDINRTLAAGLRGSAGPA